MDKNTETPTFLHSRGVRIRSFAHWGIAFFFKICRLLNIRLSSGYLFRSVSKKGTITSCALDPSALRLGWTHVKQLQGSLSSTRFTLHGFRSGAAISMTLADVSLNDIIDHVGWKSSKTALHDYIKLKQVLNPAGPAAKLADSDKDTGKHYKVTNELTGFVTAFPE